MEDILYKEQGVHLKKGVNLSDLMSKGTEMQIDLDFKKKRDNTFLNGDACLYPDMGEDDDSDSGEDIIKNLENSAERMMLSSPEYLSFDDLATKMMDCLPNGEVKILIIEEGDGPLLPVDAEVTIHYAAYWEKSNIPFDSTLTMNYGEPMRVRLGEGKIIPGLEIALTTVKGPTAQFHLLVQPNMAWGKLGVPPRIKPEPALFVIALYSVRDTHAHFRFNELPSEEQSKYGVTKKTVESLHNHAKDLFSRKRYEKSIGFYQHAISVLRLSQTNDKTEQEEIKRLKINSYLNLAVCYYKIHKPKYIINMLECLDLIIDVGNNCKALFYYGRAYEMLGKTDKALEYYSKALNLEPKNKDIGKTLAALDKSKKEAATKEKDLWQKAFKSAPEKNENVVYDVDDDFQNGVREMCQDLAGMEEYAKVDLPPGLSKGEVSCLKAMVDQFQGLIVDEDGHGKKKRISIIKKSC